VHNYKLLFKQIYTYIFFIFFSLYYKNVKKTDFILNIIKHNFIDLILQIFIILNFIFYDFG